jgi:hypothetical protein
MGIMPDRIIRCTTLTIEDASQMMTITYPRASSKGFVPFHQKIEDLLTDDTKPVTVADIRERLATTGVVATWNEVDRAIHYRRDVFVNIRRQGFMLRSVYDRLPIKWFETTDAIVQAAETGARSLAAPASIEEIRKILRKQGIDIHGEGDRILRKAISRSGRFMVASTKPTLWQLKPEGSTSN